MSSPTPSLEIGPPPPTPGFPVLDFGKWKLYSIDQVPHGYLSWITGPDFDKAYWKDAADQELKRRKALGIKNPGPSDPSTRARTLMPAETLPAKILWTPENDPDLNPPKDPAHASLWREAKALHERANAFLFAGAERPEELTEYATTIDIAGPGTVFNFILPDGTKFQIKSIRLSAKGAEDHSQIVSAAVDVPDSALEARAGDPYAIPLKSKNLKVSPDAMDSVVELALKDFLLTREKGQLLSAWIKELVLHAEKTNASEVVEFQGAYSKLRKVHTRKYAFLVDDEDTNTATIIRILPREEQSG